MRKPIDKTYVITPQMYELLFKCCEKYHNNIAWKFPEMCEDGYGCCGLDENAFYTYLKFEIPGLFCDVYGNPGIPRSYRLHSEQQNRWEEFDQFALLDYIEFFAQNCKDVNVNGFHNYFNHYHLTCKTTRSVFKLFQSDINSVFETTGLLYRLTDDQIIERVVENSPLTPEIEEQIDQIKEAGTKQLLEEAITLYMQPYPESRKGATEKIWDAFERLKTYNTDLDKKASVSKIIEEMADGNENYSKLFNAEFEALTKIGNDYRIRHHETNKIDIIDLRYYDYFFNRCLSLIALAIQYLE